MQENGNGYMPGMYDQDLITEMNNRIGALVVHREALIDQLDEIDSGIKRYQRALKALGDPAQDRRALPAGPTPQEQRASKAKHRAMQSMRKSPLYARVIVEVRQFAAKQEEFTQKAFREWAQIEGFDSGKSSIAFATMREPDQNIIRVSRIEKGQKYYRLTKEAINAKS